MPGKQTPAALIGIVALIAGAIAVYATADTASGESTEVAYAAAALPTTTTTTTIAPETTTTVAGEEPVESDGPLIDPSTFGTDRPDALVGGVLFDLFTSPEVGIEPNVANCTIETLNSRVSDEELLALGAATAEPEAVVPITVAALACGFTQNEVDRAIAIQRGEVPPPVSDTESDEPLIDPSTFGTERPETLVGGVLFDLLTGERVGVEPNVANCAIETLASEVPDDELLALGGATAEPAAVVPITLAGLACGIPQETIDTAIEIQRGG